MSKKSANQSPNPITQSLDPLEAASVLEPETAEQTQARAAAESEAEEAKARAAAEEEDKAARAAEAAAMAKTPPPPPAKVLRFTVLRDQTVHWTGGQMKRVRAGDVVSDEQLGPGGCDKLRLAGVPLKPENPSDDDFN
jgi:hypothetical protein